MQAGPVLPQASGPRQTLSSGCPSHGEVRSKFDLHLSDSARPGRNSVTAPLKLSAAAVTALTKLSACTCVSIQSSCCDSSWYNSDSIPRSPYI
eukprot:1408610-Rhodomonas_salina.1